MVRRVRSRKACEFSFFSPSHKSSARRWTVAVLTVYVQRTRNVLDLSAVQAETTIELIFSWRAGGRERRQKSDESGRISISLKKSPNYVSKASSLN